MSDELRLMLGRIAAKHGVPEHDPRVYVLVSEAAEIMGCGRQTARRWLLAEGWKEVVVRQGAQRCKAFELPDYPPSG